MHFIVTILLIWLFPFCLLGQDRKINKIETEEHQLKLDLPEVSVLSVEAGGDVYLRLESSLKKGVDLCSVPDCSKWINYTSSIRSKEELKSISVELIGNLPKGIRLMVNVKDDSGFGRGTIGNTIGPVSVTATPVTIITGIGACYTGSGIGKGHNLEYYLEVDDYRSLSLIEEEYLTVRYTFCQ